MALPLKSKPGLTGASALSIPKDWDATWFRNFINNLLKGADVRNAIGAGGITISGTIASPYATISGAGLINSVVGTANQIAVSTAAGVATISLAPNIVIPAPSSGTPLTINGIVAAQADILVERASSTANTLASGPNIELFDAGAVTASLLQQSGGQTELWQFNGSWNQILKVLTTRGVGINTPASGFGLAVAGAAATSPNAGGCLLLVGSSTSGQSMGLSIIAGTTSADFPLRIVNQANTIEYFAVLGNGQINFSNVGVSTSATAGAATALPANPVGYFSLAINGTVRKVPFYA